MGYETTHRIRDDESPVEVIVATIAAAENRDPASLPPIYDVVAADALNQLFTDEQRDVEVSFTYYGYRVTVSSTEVVLKSVE
ncbi:HalOD1 output domain-containing protein [Halorussus rarus]|uniref:HalOD1 output domain-containing protein n=1 Tax=Halorussus TaxID=1070314 RepID=UPI0013B36ACD|nr:HalOD1 output domain-containing protein [Halorussus rarus]NHN60032.1 hypothetical protein [Halorussus sp. JP-T4]